LDREELSLYRSSDDIRLLSLAKYLSGADMATDNSSVVDAMDAFVEKFAATIRIEGKRVANKFDVFLCHNNTDKPEVKAVAERLKEKGYLPWLDEWELRPGLSWQTALETQIANITSTAVFVGRSGIGPWQAQEIQSILRQFVEHCRPVIPVILPSCKKIPALPLFMQNQTWVDFRVLDPDPLKRLLWGITGKQDS
jgi:hypothetical protein